MSSSSNTPRFDELFLAIAQNAGKIEDLLEVFFSFLQRKTDFFHVMTTPGDSIGFPRYKAFEMVQSCFERHQLAYIARSQPHLLPTLKQQAKASPYDKPLHKPSTKPSIVKNKQCDNELSSTSLSTDQFQPPSPSSAPYPSRRTEISDQVDSHPSPSHTAAPNSRTHCDNGHPPDNESSVDGGNGSSNQNKDQKCRQGISTWNGGKTDSYWWNQSLTEATVEIVLPEPHPIVKSELKVEMKATKIKVEYKEKVIIEGEFYEQIQLDGSVWGIEDRSRLLITLEKGRENWWGCILKGDEEIDLTKVVSVKKIADFDEETQAAIRKVIWERDLKTQGLKTSEEVQIEELSRKAWNAEGSPFRGQPFDPTRFSLGSSGTLPKEILKQFESSSSPG